MTQPCFLILNREKDKMTRIPDRNQLNGEWSRGTGGLKNFFKRGEALGLEVGQGDMVRYGCRG
jgi:hypothetical protein